MTEQEQIEVLKNWLKQYLPVIIAGILLAILFSTGWRYWQQRQNKILIHASQIYDEMLTLRAQNNNTLALVQAKKIYTHYPKTPYGEMAAFALARDSVNQLNYPDAEKYLNWILKHSKTSGIRQIARLRLARILIAQKKIAESFKQLNKIDDDTFKPLIDETIGDAYFAKNQFQEARKYYKKALSALPNAEVIRPILQMKYDNLTA